MAKILSLYFVLIASIIYNVAIAQTSTINKLNSEQQNIQAQEASEWVVVLNDPRPARLQGWLRNQYHKSSGEYRGSLELERYGRSIATKYKMELRDQWLIPSLGVYCLVVRFNDDKSETIANLKKNKAVQWVQPSNDFELLSAKTQSQLIDKTKLTTPVDDTINSAADGGGVVIAIIDSAVDDSHQDLAGQIAQSGDFVITRESSDSKEQLGEMHGTAIAGVLIADRNTKLGVAGVAPGATLKAYRGCWEASETNKTNCNTLSLARALDAVSASNTDILNLSLSGPKDLLLDRLIQRIIDQGTIVVTAFDPTRPAINRFPSQRDGVLIVRAQDLDNQHTEFFTAPGARVVLSPGNKYDFMHGHSVASAYTSGLLALRKQVFETAIGGKKQADWRMVSNDQAAQDLLSDILMR